MRDDHIKHMLELVDKRLAYCKQAKPCPECSTNQVQLVKWIDGPIWKCRKCKHKWEGV